MSNYLDHIFIPVAKVDLDYVCEIFDDDALNVSTHRPVFCQVDLLHVKRSSKSFPSVKNCVQWRRPTSDSISNFRENVESKCLVDGMHVRNLNSADDIDKLYKDVTLVPSAAFKDHLPFRKGFKQHLKPYWNDTL